MKTLNLYQAGLFGLLVVPRMLVAEESPLHLDDIDVSADPLDATSQHIVQPVSVLVGEDLERKQGNVLTDLLDNEPGLSSAGYGPRVGRPVIRGQSGARVGVMLDGISSMDVSTISPDHNVALDPLFVNQVEVLRGPATLLYGSSASGGVVNVLTDQILDYVPDGLEGEVVGEYGFASNALTTGLNLNYGIGELAIHLDTIHRHSDNLSIPGFELVDAHDEDTAGELTNSDIDSHDTTVGLSWVTDRGFVGISVNSLDNEYGIPGHTHAHEDEHDEDEDHDDDDHDDDDHDEDEDHHEDEHGEEEAVRLTQRQTRVDLKAELQNPFAGFELIKTRWGFNDHTHTEGEGDHIGTRLENKEWQGRVELLHSPLAGWEGALGFQYQHRDLTTSGEEAFLPSSELESIGLFLLERQDFGQLHTEFGFRYEHQETESVETANDISHDLFSFSGGLGYHWSEQFTTHLNFTRSERAPALEELYSNGAHLATQTFEIGDQGLDKETSYALDLSFDFRSDRLRSEFTLFATWIDDFIYLSEQDLNGDGIADRVEGDFDGSADSILLDDDELLLVQHTQADARFYGIELDNRLTLYRDTAQTVDMRLWADYTRGRLDSDQNLPRITPWRVGTGLDYHRGDWLYYVDVTHVGKANHLAPLETDTDSYTLLNLGVNWKQKWGKGVIANWSLRGTNLLDEEVRPHTSFVKDVAPREGRSAILSLRVKF